MWKQHNYRMRAEVRHFIGTNKEEGFLKEETIALIHVTRLNCRCQNPFATMSPPRETESKYRFVFEHKSFSGALFL